MNGYHPIPWHACVALAVALTSANGATVRELVSLPTTGIVLANAFGGGTAVTDRAAPNQFEAMGQMIEDTALDGDEIDIGTLYLKVSNGTTIPATGTHQIDIWIGEWDNSDNTPSTEVTRQAFDVSGMEFVDGRLYGFDFSESFSLEETKDYAFEVWWTSDDDSHEIAWERDTGQGSVDGGFISEKDPGLSLPFAATPANNTDMYFAFESVPEPSVSCFALLSGGLLALRRRA